MQPATPSSQQRGMRLLAVQSWAWSAMQCPIKPIVTSLCTIQLSTHAVQRLKFSVISTGSYFHRIICIQVPGRHCMIKYTLDLYRNECKKGRCVHAGKADAIPPTHTLAHTASVGTSSYNNAIPTDGVRTHLRAESTTMFVTVLSA